MKTLLHELIVPAVRNGVATTCDWGLVPLPSVAAALSVRARRNLGDGGKAAAEARQVVGDGDDNLCPSAASEQEVYYGDDGTSPVATSHAKRSAERHAKEAPSLPAGKRADELGYEREDVLRLGLLKRARFLGDDVQDKLGENVKQTHILRGPEPRSSPQNYLILSKAECNHEGDSQQHARSSRPTAEATAGQAMDLDGLSTATATAAPPRAAIHGPAAEALQDGAEYDAETDDAAEASESEAAAAARVRPPRPSNWGTMTRVQRKMWKKQGGRPRHHPGPATVSKDLGTTAAVNGDMGRAAEVGGDL